MATTSATATSPPRDPRSVAILVPAQYGGVLRLVDARRLRSCSDLRAAVFHIMVLFTLLSGPHHLKKITRTSWVQVCDTSPLPGILHFLNFLGPIL